MYEFGPEEQMSINKLPEPSQKKGVSKVIISKSPTLVAVGLYENGAFTVIELALI